MNHKDIKINLRQYDNLLSQAQEIVDCGLDHFDYQYPASNLYWHGLKRSVLVKLHKDGYLDDEDFKNLVEEYEDAIKKEVYETVEYALENIFEREQSKAYEEWEKQPGKDMHRYPDGSRIPTMELFDKRRNELWDEFNAQFKSEIIVNDDLIEDVLYNIQESTQLDYYDTPLKSLFTKVAKELIKEKQNDS